MKKKMFFFCPSYKKRQMDALNAEDDGELAQYEEAKLEEKATEERLTGVRSII